MRLLPLIEPVSQRLLLFLQLGALLVQLGELVPTEAELARAEGRDYEPASVLLERIRKEREAAGPTAGRKRKKATPEKAPAKATSLRPQR